MNEPKQKHKSTPRRNMMPYLLVAVISRVVGGVWASLVVPPRTEYVKTGVIMDTTSLLVL